MDLGQGVNGCRIAVRNAVVEIWQTDIGGAYIHTRSPIQNRDAKFQQLASLTGPAIFAPNHQSHIDTLLVLDALPFRFRNVLTIAIAHLGNSWLSRLRTFLSFRLPGMAVVASRPSVLLTGLNRLCSAAKQDCSILI